MCVCVCDSILINAKKDSHVRDKNIYDAIYIRTLCHLFFSLFKSTKFPPTKPFQLNSVNAKKKNTTHDSVSVE